MADAAALLTTLADPPVHLEPIDESHREALRAAMADDEGFWPLYPRSFGAGRFDESFDQVVGDRRFATFSGGVLIGMTAYLNVDAASDALEIGGTYLTRTARGAGINGRVKRLMIDHALACGFDRIEFRVDARNARSLAALAKLGAVREGVLRRQRRIWTGHVRDTVVLSILGEDWRARG